jgi:WD40 repeat protein
MDKTVRLWHASRPECLCCFQHSDFVTSIQFHPKDDRFFLAGSLDTKLRLWSIPDKSVAYVTTVPDMITAVGFTPDGKYSMAGCLNGLLNIYDTEALKVSGQIHVRSARGRNSKGNKITGIDTMVVPQDGPYGDIKLLVTTNDSRIRLYNFQERTIEAKFRGNENTCSQIRATFTDDGKHVICGSEDRKAYVWPIGPVEQDGDARAVEVFETQGAIVTVAITAPTATKQALGLSDDPIYDICNPPPVALMSTEEAAKQADSSRDTESLHKQTASAPRLSVVSKMAQESPGYLSRSTHPDGNIIVIADYSGKIKILRQDCAYQKRKHENWHESSTFSRRLLRRSNSGRHSVASSTGKDSNIKTPSERIISWRNSVVRHGRTSTEGSRAGLRSRSPSPPHRPTPTFRLSSSRPSSLAPNESLSAVTSPQPSPHRPFRHNRSSGEQKREQPKEQDARIMPGRDADVRKLPSSSADIVNSGKDKDNPLWLQGDHSYAYWNKITHDALAMKQRHTNDLLSPNSVRDRRLSTAGSVLSSDYGSSTGASGEEDILKCDNCRGTNFRGVKGRDGKQKLICVQCNHSVA